MKYTDFAELQKNSMLLQTYAMLKCEQGGEAEVTDIISKLTEDVELALEKINSVPDEPELLKNEPDLLDEIKALRPEGPRKMLDAQPANIDEKMKGALYARIIGCLMGVPVEGWAMERIEEYSKLIGQDFPPTDYYPVVEQGYVENVYKRYRHEYDKDKMTFAPVDDDIIYTQIALLIMEEYGNDFTTADVGEFWSKHLPYACTAEEVALINLEAGVPTDELGVVNNPYRQWIGAAIRSDGFGYAAAGYPEKAAQMAYEDAYLTHRRNGIYGEMYLAAAQAAAFATDDIREALEIGLSEIPRDCLLARDIKWALDKSDEIVDFKEAVLLVRERFGDMSLVHTNNNLCLVIFGLLLGKGDILNTLSIIVAMGMDNDCTAASAGSIVGAIAGFSKVPAYLYERFGGVCDTYLTGVEKFNIDDMAERFVKLNKEILA